jgi:hypothetical protein
VPFVVGAFATASRPALLGGITLIANGRQTGHEIPVRAPLLLGALVGIWGGSIAGTYRSGERPRLPDTATDRPFGGRTRLAVTRAAPTV